jgi:hypothetical protein
MTERLTPNKTITLHAPLWPVLVAPLVAGVYYLAIKLAFVQSIVSVMGRTDLFETSFPRWGTNWTFRAAAEVVAAGFGTFIAASLAPGRQRVAAIVGGCAISLGFIAKLAFALADWNNLDPDEHFVPEPWYQYAIDALMIVGAPMMGVFVSESAQDLYRNEPRGLGGINRLHLIWLWLAAYFYALGLITPVARIYAPGEPNIIATFVTLLINGIPAAALAIPGYYGIAFLSGYHGSTMHPAGRNMVGVLVLIFGYLVGVGIQFGWYWAAERVFKAIFG